MGWALIKYDWCPYKKGRLGQGQRTAHEGTEKKATIGNPKRKISGETKPDTSILNFQTPEL